MNTTITIQNRIWPPLLAAGTALALAVGLLTFVVLQQQTVDPATGGPTIPAAPTEVPQARWKIETRVAGPKRIPKALRKRGLKRGAEVSRLVRGIFNAIYLEPESAATAIRRSFTKPAAAAIRKPGIGLPKGAERVETTRRRIAVTVYAGTGAQAVARALVAAKGIAGGKPFRIRHDSTLWLVRRGGDWSVIAFEIAREP